SLGVLQAFLDAKFQDRSITLLPKFGAATTEELLESINQEGRIFRLHPGFETSGKIKAPLFTTVNDFHLALLGSRVPVLYRKFLSRAYSVMDNSKINDPDRDAYLQRLKSQILNLTTLTFRQGRDPGRLSQLIRNDFMP